MVSALELMEARLISIGHFVYNHLGRNHVVSTLGHQMLSARLFSSTWYNASPASRLFLGTVDAEGAVWKSIDMAATAGIHGVYKMTCYFLELSFNLVYLLSRFMCNLFFAPISC